MTKRKLLLISDDEQGRFILNESARFIGDGCLFEDVTHILAGDDWRYIEYDGEKGFIDALHDLYQTNESNFNKLYYFIEFVNKESILLEYYEICNNAKLIYSDMSEIKEMYEIIQYHG